MRKYVDNSDEKWEKAEGRNQGDTKSDLYLGMSKKSDG